MAKYFRCAIRYNPFDLPYRHIKFLGKRFKVYAVNEPPAENIPVPGIMDPLTDQVFDFAVRYVVVHRFQFFCEYAAQI